MSGRTRLHAPGSMHHVFEFHRARIAIGLVKRHAVALAEVTRLLGVSTSAISKIIKRAS